MISPWYSHEQPVFYRVDDSNTIYPLVNKQFAIEHGHLQFFCLPIKNGDFQQLCKRLPEGIL